MDDISDATSVATSTPEDAAKNISNANLFNVDPRYASQNKDTFDQKANFVLRPQEAEPPVADYMKQSSEHAALATPDVDHLSWMAKQTKMISDYVFDRPTTDQKIVDLTLKKMNNGGKLESDDEIALMSANQDAQDQSTRDYGLHGLATLPAHILGGITEFGESVVRGARKGLFESGLPSYSLHKPAVVAGALYYGIMAKDPYDQISAGTYNALSNLSDANGQPKNLDEDTKLAYSHGVAAIGTALMNVGGAAVAETAPFLKPLMNPVLASGLINTPAKAAIIIGLGNALKGAAAVGGATAGTELAQVIAEQMGKNKGTDEAGFWNSLAAATTKVNAKRVASAGGQGALTGLAMEAPLQALGYRGVKQSFQDHLDYVMANRQAPPMRDVTPTEPKQLSGAVQPNPDMPIDITPSEGGGGDGKEQAFKALQMNEALHNINDVQKSTNMHNVAPSELNDVNKLNFAAAGMENLHTTSEALKDWANTDEKLDAVKKIMGVPESQINQPLSVPSHDIMEIARKYPDILDHVQSTPDGPSAITAKEHIEALNRAEEERTQLMTKLGIKPEEVQPPSNVTDLPKREEPTIVPQDFFNDAKRAQEILDEQKSIAEKTDSLNALQSKDVPDIKDNEAIKELKNGLTNATKRQADLETELAKIKERVTQALKENPPGSVLSFPYDEQKAALNAEMNYGRTPTFTEAIKKVLPPEAVDKYNSSQIRAKMNYADLVHDAAVHEMNRVVDQTKAMAMEDARRGELERTIHDPNYAIIDKFHMHQIGNAKGKAKRSIYAVDPSSLPDDLLHYGEDPQLKKHKLFVKGANSLEDSAKALGFSSGKDMLDVMAKTPTRDQIIKARTKFYTSDIEQLSKAGVDLDHTNIMKAFDNRAMAHYEEMKFLKDQEWGSVKYGIKKIALPLPRMEDLEHEVRESVKKMRIGDLSIQQSVVGERKSQKIAINSILKNEVEKAFQAKEAAIRNALMQKEVRKSIAEINRAQKFFRALEEPTAQETLRVAGSRYSKAIDEITDNYNFNPKRKGQSEQNSFNKWARKEVESGRGDFSIPDRLSDVRKSLNDMTPEQVSVAFDRAKTIFNEAKYKNELIDNKELRDDERDMDRISDTIILKSSEHPGTSNNNFKDVQGNGTPFKALRLFMQDKMTLFSNMEHTLRYYDQGKLSGYFQELLMHQLKGDGKWDLKSGYSKENAKIEKFAKTAKAIMDNHGDYHNLERKKLNIPEFADVPSLDHGRLTKADLMVAWAYKGDPQGLEKLGSNFLDKNGRAIDIKTWQKVFDRELSEADVTAQQYSVDMYKEYQDETRDLQQRVKGEDVVFVKGVPNEHNGKFYPGGYVPLKYKHEWSAEAAKQTIQMLEDKRASFYEKDDGAEYGRQFAAEQTEQGRLIERTNNDKPLDLSLMRFWRGHEEVIHDLSYREPVMNTLKILKDKRVREAMIHMGGESRFNLVTNSVIEMAGRAEAMNANYFSDQNRFLKNMFGHLQNNFNVTVLGMNIFTSTPIQYESLTQLWQNMGRNGLKHFGKANAQMAMSPHLASGFYNFANELDPTIGHFLEQLQNKITSQVHDIVPTKTNFPMLSPLKSAHEYAVSVAMSPMALADIHLKVMGALGGYSQFMAGDVENWPKEKVMGLSEEERHQQAQAYVRQLSRLSLTHGRPEDKAPFQKSPIANFFSNYWNDARNVLNNQINQGHKTSWKAEEGYNAAKEGRTKEAAGHYAAAASIAMATILYATMSRWYSDKIRGIQQTPDQWNLDLKSPSGLMEASEKMGSYMMLSPADQFASVEPIMRETFFAQQMPDRYVRGKVDKTKNVQIPITKELSDIATAAGTLSDAVQQSNNLSEFLYYMTHLDNKETKALLNAESYLGIPIPVNAYSHLMKLVDLPLNSPLKIGQSSFEKLDGAITQFKKSPAADNVSPQFHAELDKIQEKIAPVVVKIPENMTDTMKYAMSGADWSKPDGIYGFSKDQWNEVKAAAPDLGLTDSGRISKNIEQQEKAMDWYLHDTAAKLAEKDIRVDKTSLYSSFVLGVDKYEALYKAPSDTKLKTVLGAEDIAKNPDFLNFKTVGQLKIYLNDMVNKKHPPGPTAQLTEPTKKVEDGQ